MCSPSELSPSQQDDDAESAVHTCNADPMKIAALCDSHIYSDTRTETQAGHAPVVTANQQLHG